MSLIFAAPIIPAFYFHHQIQDGGKLPAEALADLGITTGELGETKAGLLPYSVLLAGTAVVRWANWFFVLPT